MTGTSPTVGDLRLATVVINVRDMERAVAFWTAVLGYLRRDNDPEFCLLLDPDRTGLTVSLQLTDAAPTGPARVHVDLYTAEQATHVERLVGLGATRVDDWPYPENPDFVVMRDPDGNEFCVIDHQQA